MNNKKNIVVYVDGFNLYHAIKNLRKPYLKWLNLVSLVEKFINSKIESIKKIYYFSAVATHLGQDTINRHKVYIEALQTAGIEFIEGHFKKKQLKYKNQQVEILWNKHEEKETDVNIGIYMVRDAVGNLFDKFILISNDTDIVPALKMVKTENQQLEIKILTPPTFKTHDSLRKAISPGKSSHITDQHVNQSLFSEMIEKPNGKVIHIPPEYRRPSDI